MQIVRVAVEPGSGFMDSGGDVHLVLLFISRSIHLSVYFLICIYAFDSHPFIWIISYLFIRIVFRFVSIHFEGSGARNLSTAKRKPSSAGIPAPSRSCGVELRA